MSKKIEPVACCHRLSRDGVSLTSGWFSGDLSSDDEARLNTAGYQTERAYSATTVSALEARVRELEAAAKAVLWFDWSGNDDDAAKAMDDLGDAVNGRAP